VLLRAPGSKTPLLRVTCPRRIQSVFSFPLLFGDSLQKVTSSEHKVHFSYQKLQQAPSKRESVSNPGRESEQVKIKGREQRQAEERERRKRTVRKSVGKFKAASASECSRQRNSLAESDSSKADPVEIQLSLAFWLFCSESASGEPKVSFPYQKLQQTPSKRVSASIFPRQISKQ